MQAKGTVFKYGDNVDTDVIIPARYLNSSDPSELAGGSGHSGSRDHRRLARNAGPVPG